MLVFILLAGADNVKQLREANEDELQDILTEVKMTKPFHISRLKKALKKWDEGQKGMF